MQIHNRNTEQNLPRQDVREHQTFLPRGIRKREMRNRQNMPRDILRRHILPTKSPHNQPNTNKLTKTLQPTSDQKNVYRKNDNKKRNRKTTNTTIYKNMYAEKHLADKDTIENTYNKKNTLTQNCRKKINK